MRWRPWLQERPKSLSGALRNALAAHQIRVEPGSLVRLRYVTKMGDVFDHTTKLVRIYDPLKLPEGYDSVANYDDLNSHHEAIVAEGFIDGGLVCLYRLSSPSTARRGAVVSRYWI